MAAISIGAFSGLTHAGLAATGTRRWRLSPGLWQISAALLCAAHFWSAEAGAVLISSGDGTENTQNPSFFGWDYVGEVNGLSATYLGNGWVITANHVGPGDFLLDGTVYPWIPGTEVQLETNASNDADLLVFGVWPEPDLDPLPIRTSPPPVGEFLIMIGAGRDRGTDTSWDPNGPSPPPPDTLFGWTWGATRSKRWGTNEVESLTTGLISGTVSFYTSFDDGVVLPEAQAAAGDSGGAVFSINAGGTELAGIIYATGPTPGQPAGVALFTNLTFVARLDFYGDQIADIIAVPEPAVALPWGIALLAFLRRTRRRSAARCSDA